MSHLTQPIPTTSQGIPGSTRYGIDHGRCYDVQGIYKYGQVFADCDDPAEAASLALYKNDVYSVWVPNGTLLEIWKVGPRDYQRSGVVRFVVVDGEAEVAQ